MSFLLSKFIYADPRVYTYGPIEKLLQGNTNQKHIKVITSHHIEQLLSKREKSLQGCKEKEPLYIFLMGI